MAGRTGIALAGLAGLALTAGGGVLAAHGTSRATVTCASAGSSTLYDDPEVRVFIREREDGRVRTVACSHHNGRRTRLAQTRLNTNSSLHVNHIAAPGRWLGYAVTIYDQQGSASRVCALRIATGERRCTFGGAVVGMGATKAGSYAWLAYYGYDSNGDPFCCEVNKRAAGAEDPVTLDSGPDIETNSLAVAGHRVYWTKAGEPHSATVP